MPEKEQMQVAYFEISGMGYRLLAEPDEGCVGEWEEICVVEDCGDPEWGECGFAECMLLDAYRAQAEQIRLMVEGMDDLIANSHGVDGLHLNGDVATWEELGPEGEYHGWLDWLDAARQEGGEEQANPEQGEPE